MRPRSGADVALSGLAVALAAVAGGVLWQGQPAGGLLLLAAVVCGWLSVRRPEVSKGADDSDPAAERQNLRELTNQLPVLVCVVDAEERYEFVNAAHERLHGAPHGALEGKRLCDVLPQDVYQEIQPEILRALAGETVRFETESVDPSTGSSVWHEATYVPRHDESGEVTGFYSHSSNVTRRRQAEREGRSLEERMLRAQKLESLSALAGGVAHEFNNILATILGNAQLAQSLVSGGQDATEELEQIGQGTRRAAELCRQMLTYAGNKVGAAEPIDVTATAREMVSVLSASLDSRAELRFELAESPTWVYADAAQIRQVLVSLITNAAEATTGDSGSIVVSTGSSSMSRETLAATHVDDGLSPGDYVFIEVADTGSGMNESTAATVFDPFFTTKFAGRGLGMAAVLGIVRSHGGAIELSTSEGDGTTIRVLLPAAEPVTEHVANAVTVDLEEWRGTGRVLVVDDEEGVRRTTRRILQRCGLEVTLASNGRDALEQFRARGGEFDLVLLDLTMPVMDGEAAFAEFRAMRPELPVIVFTGYTADEVRKRFRDESVTGMLEKPFSMDSLINAVRGALEGE